MPISRIVLGSLSSHSTAMATNTFDSEDVMLWARPSLMTSWEYALDHSGPILILLKVERGVGGDEITVNKMAQADNF